MFSLVEFSTVSFSNLYTGQLWHCMYMFILNFSWNMLRVGASAPATEDTFLQVLSTYLLQWNSPDNLAPRNLRTCTNLSSWYAYFRVYFSSTQRSVSCVLPTCFWWLIRHRSNGWLRGYNSRFVAGAWRRRRGRFNSERRVGEQIKPWRCVKGGVGVGLR